MLRSALRRLLRPLQQRLVFCLLAVARFCIGFKRPPGFPCCYFKYVCIGDPYFSRSTLILFYKCAPPYIHIFHAHPQRYAALHWRAMVSCVFFTVCFSHRRASVARCYIPLQRSTAFQCLCFTSMCIGGPLTYVVVCVC